jgi:hypothetical protein
LRPFSVLFLGVAVCGLGCRRHEAPASSTPAGSVPGAAASPSPNDDARPLPDPLPTIAARVNGQPIWIRIVLLYVQKTHGKEVIGNLDKPHVIREALERCIDRELLFQEALVQKLTPSDGEIQAAYERSRREYPNDEDWDKYLLGRHLTNDLYKAEIRTEKTVGLLMRQTVGNLTPVSDEEARKYFDAHPEVFETGERIRARRLIIKNPLLDAEGRSTLRAKLLPKVMMALKTTGDFVTVARRYSTEGSWQDAGKDVVLRREELAEPVAEAAFKLKPGEMTDFIDIQYGFELVKVEQRLPSEALTYDRAAPRLKKLLTEQRDQETLQKVLDPLRTKARIERFL